MTSYGPGIATLPPPTLEKQLEVLAAAHALAAQDDELLRRRCEEIVTLRRAAGELALRFEELQHGYGALVELVQERRRRDPRLRSHVIRDDFDQSAVAKARPEDPKHPGWPAGTPDGRGGQFRPKAGEGAPTAIIPVQYGPNPHFPPPPPGYDPKTWTQGRWWNTKWYFLKDPEGNVYTAHPEDDGHWRHWDKRDGDNNDQGRWPPNSLKPREGQKRLREDQSTSDPNGDAPPWTPKPDPVIPATPFPDQFPTIRAPAPTEIIIPRFPLVVPP